ncbi:nuclear transport factor 2 family protein [Alicycliphilus denitrificans]|uniref:nuclear transport factor 2 family protein n=1 Tax=Alicycliphilus denitrificans TaxID=179636 RepID=UPI00384C33B9
MSAEAVTQITQLLYRYAEHIDQGQLEQAAAMFAQARIHAGGKQPLDVRELLALWRRLLILYPCGTPRTRHLITNSIINVADDRLSASARSCYTVLQAVDGFALQAIASGCYHDRFSCIDGVWQFAERDYRQLDFVGDLSRHLRTVVKPGAIE